MSNSDQVWAALAVTEEAGVRFVEGPPQASLIHSPENAALVIEACLSHGVDSALLYASNLPDRFFDLSSGEAGAILQKLRNYHIRLAVVCPHGAIQFSSRFGEMVVEERKGSYFRLFDSAPPAREWLSER